MTDAIEQFLSRLHHPTLAAIDMSLDRVYRLLGMLGSPHKRLPPVIHVAGTNGKGSLIAYLQAIFEAAGKRVHRYTSPHLVHFRERIVLAGREIENNYLESILRHVAPVLQAQPATFFEATTAVAFLAFAEKPADIVLLETGMGGRLDATNVIDKPLLTAITPISYDHCQHLGNTLTAIAGEKAGILKRGIPCVVGRQVFEALAVIEKATAEKNVSLSRLGREWQIENSTYRSASRTLTLHPSLAGAHQYDNAATAAACIDALPAFGITDAQVTQGIASAVWPARLQPLKNGRYARILPQGIELWLDGGHNPQGGEMLANWLKTQSGKEIHLVCGMLNTKDSTAYLKHVAPYVASFYGIAIPGEKLTQTAEQVAATAQAAGIAHAAPAPNVEKALQSIAGHAKKPAIACICGSLYLAGKVLATN